MYNGRQCFLCGRNGAYDHLDEHHIFEGRTGNREHSDEYGLTVYLCHERCHIFGRQAAHNCRATADMLHRYGQRKLMLEQGWTVEEFRQTFGKNYLDEDEIAAIRDAGRGTRELAFEELDEPDPLELIA